jgi:cephalosporin-C deacetylase-like acetyl esterase
MSGYDAPAVRATRPPLTRPDGFFPFWRTTLAALATVAPNPRLGLAFTSPEGARITPVRFASLDARDVQGFLITLDDPEDLAAAERPVPRPLVVTTHGYNSQCNPVLEARHTVACGADLFCFDVRGFGLSRSACEVDPRGYILTGLTDPRTSILRGAVCDYVRAAEVARRLGAGRTGVVFHGRSYGGALAFLAQGLTARAAYLAVALPTFGWVDGRRQLVTRGSGQEINDHLARNPRLEAAAMATLRYFDTVNVADRIACPTLMGVARRDEVVPAATVYAIANHMDPPPEIIELPVGHSTDDEERRWTDFDKRWTTAVAALGASRPAAS